MSSISRFLILISLAVITLVVFIASLQGYRSGLESTDRLIGQMLEEKALLVAGLSFERDLPSEVVVPVEELFFQLFDSQGRLVTRSQSAPIEPLTSLEGGFKNQSFAGYRWRLFTFEVPETGDFVVVGERLDMRYFLAEDVIIKTIMPVLWSLPFFILLIWFVVTRGLKPLSRLSTEVSMRRSQDLTPIEQSGMPTELRPLLESMNDLLHRLSASFDREKRFSGDAAHELRTPLSALKINLYNLKSQLPADDQDVQAMEQSLSRMEHLIEQLLILYRISPEQYQINFQRLDLKALCQQVIVENFSAIDRRGHEVSLEGTSVWIEGDEFSLKTMIKNLLDNANKYTPENGIIRLSVFSEEHLARLLVEDSGVGIPADLRERAFERFYRVFGDQNAFSSEGCGLGLSIVGHIVDRHFGQIRLLESKELSGLCVEVCLPLGQQESNSDR